MKIVLLTGFFDENFVYREHAYADYLNKAHIDYVILTSTLTLSQKSKKGVLIDSGKYNIIRKKPWLSIKDIVFFKSFKQLNSINPDIIHLFDAQQGIALSGTIYAIVKRKKIIYDHELQRVPIGFLARIRFALLTFPILLFVTLFADKLRCVTPSGFLLLKKINPLCVKKITLQPLGYVRKEIGPTNIPFELPDSDNLISMTGYFDKYKNIKPILAAFLRSNFEKFNSYFIIVGPIFEKESLDFIKKTKRIIYYDQLLKQDQLEYVLMKSKINIWPKSTSTIFEALKYNNYVILPANLQTSHLKSKQIKLVDNFVYYNIKNEINYCFEHSKVSDNSSFDYDNILKNLLADYKELYNEK